MIYDALLLIAIIFVATLPIVWILSGPAMPPNNDVTLLQLSTLELVLYRLYLLAICFGFIGGFWVHGGQTPGMRVWRIRIVADDNGAVRWTQALGRFCAAWCSIGLGFIWMLVDRNKLTLYDRWSGAHLALLPKPEKRSRKPANQKNG